MANVKNFGLVGVGTTVQFGKAGPSLAANSSTVLQAAGNAAFILPSGTVGQRPTGVAGMLRFNDDTDVMEYYTGSTWSSLATGGAAVTSVSGTTDRITSTGGLTPVIDIASTYVGQTSITTLGTVTTGTWEGDVVSPIYGGTGVNNGTNTLTLGGNLTTSGAFASTFTMTGATNVTFPTSGTLATVGGTVSTFSGGTTGLTPASPTSGAIVLAGTLNAVNGGTGLSTFASGSVLYASAADTWSAAAPGATSGVQAWDADLDALAGLATTGYIVRTGAGTATTRAITGTAGNIVVTNGSGVSSDTTINLDTVSQAATGDFVKVTLDTFGRVTGNTAVVTADITALVDSVYVNVAGDSMTSAANLTFSGGGQVLGLPSVPVGNTAATSKAYVDALVAGLSWKQAVQTGSGTNISLAAPGATIGGFSPTAGDRILLIGQTDPYENGIYVFDTAATPLVRSTDADTYQELNNASVFVADGTYVDTGWVQSATLTSLTSGTTQLWVQFSGANAYIAGAGLLLTGNSFSVNFGAGIAQLPSDEVGIDVVAAKAVQLTGGAAGDQLTFVLDGDAASGLEQSAAGLKISATGVTNAMLLNSGVTLNADVGTNTTLSLGGTLEIAGSSSTGILTTLAANTITVSGVDASDTQKGVASFDTTGFTVTAGNVVLNDIDLGTMVTGTLPVANGGTGATSFTATRLLIGDGTNPVTTDALLTFVTASNTLTVGTATIAGTDAGDVTITSTESNADINLNPTGTGSVVIGPAGPGLIQSDTGNTLTVSGDTGLTLRADTSGDITLDLAASNAYKVSVVGPTDAQYIDGLASNDLVTKYYVDTVAGNTVGDVKAVQATVVLTAAASVNIGAALPAGSTILSVKVNVTAASDAVTTVVVGKSGGSQYMTAAENDPETTGLYLAETMVTEAGSEQVQATVATPGAVGSCVVVVTYKLA